MPTDTRLKAYAQIPSVVQTPWSRRDELHIDTTDERFISILYTLLV